MAEKTYLYGYGTGPYGASPTRRTKEYILAQSIFARVHPELMRRLFGLADWVISLGGDYGFGGGWRSPQQQFNLFRSRYTKVAAGQEYTLYWNSTPNPTYTPYLGYYKHTSGASSTPPYWTYHEYVTNNSTEYALAVDMVGNHTLANEYSGMFGLTDFSDVNQEPWHYQGIEYPRSRRQYNGSFENPVAWPLPGDPTPPQIPNMSSFKFSSPVRILDTRPEQPVVTHNPAKGTFTILSVKPHGFTPSNVSGVVLTVTGIGSSYGFFTFWSGEGGYPVASNVNVAPGLIENNMVWLPIHNGAFGVYSSAPNHLIIDQVGWYYEETP